MTQAKQFESNVRTINQTQLMTQSYVTLKKNNPIAQEWLNGFFDSEEKFIPVSDACVELQFQEKITFLKVDPKKQSRSFWLVLLSILRPLEFLQIILPLSFVYFYWGKEHLVPENVISCFIVFTGILFLVSGFFILNDYYGHISGKDWFNSESGSQVIQRGWVAPWKLKWMGYFLFFLGLIFGFPALKVNFMLFLLLGIVLVTVGLKFRHFGAHSEIFGINEFVIFSFMGPFLILGFSIAVFNTVNDFIFGFSVWVGLQAVLIYCLKNFEHLFVLSKKQANNWMVKFGFDSGKRLIAFLLMINFFVVFVLSQMIFKDWRGLVLIVLNVIFIFYLLYRLKQTKTCLGGALVNLRKIGIIKTLFLVGAWNLLIFL